MSERQPKAVANDTVQTTTRLAPVRNKPIKTKQLSVTIKLKFTLNIPLPLTRELLSVAKLRE